MSDMRRHDSRSLETLAVALQRVPTHKPLQSWPDCRLCAQDACYKPPGSCLANQLKDLYTADVALVAKGSTPLHFITRYGGGNTGGKQA